MTFIFNAEIVFSQAMETGNMALDPIVDEFHSANTWRRTLGVFVDGEVGGINHSITVLAVRF